jgi:hypothetical protein
VSQYYSWPDRLTMTRSSSFTDAEHEAIVSSAMRNQGLRRDQAEKLVESVCARPSKRNPLLERQWVRTLVQACDDLREDRAHPNGLYATTFWIRLYGAITDLLARFEKYAKSHREMLAQGVDHPWLAAASLVFDACIAIRDSLSDDELVFAAFARHVHAHVYQNGFEYSIERGNPDQRQRSTLRTKQMVRTLHRHVDVDEAHRIFDRVLAKYAHDEARIVVNFAHKVGPHVEYLGRAMEGFEREREKDRAETAARLSAAGQPASAAADPAAGAPRVALKAPTRRRTRS